LVEVHFAHLLMIMIDKQEFYSSYLTLIAVDIAVFYRHFADKLFGTRQYRVVLLGIKHPLTKDKK